MKILILSAITLVACGPAQMTTSASSSAISGDIVKNWHEVLWLAHDAGLPCDSTAVIATAIAYAESSFDVYATDYDSDGSVDYGLWQINSVHGLSEAYLFNSSNNAHAMYEISSGGTDWTPWSTYNSGAYEQYTSTAWTAWGEKECEN